MFISKYHYNEKGLTDICKIDNCKRKHAVRLFNLNTSSYLPYVLDCEKIGKLYNSNEIVLDDYQITAKAK